MKVNRFEIESELIKLIQEQLALKVTNDTDVLSLDHDFPTDEILKELFEVFGIYDLEPGYEAWNGTVAELAEIATRNLTER
jgi:hypothetical protein